jgi:DNA-binding winged helix-turn-helix (wHTH) protein/Tol biopolymer transport system component
MPTISNPVRFGPFDLDLHSGELHKGGIKIRLADQPLQILALLLERPGQVVTREELRQHLWSSDTFVDFEHGLNAAVKRLREALGDSADTPRFIETLPRHGYRFIAPVDGLEVSAQAGVRVIAETRQHKGTMFGIALLVLALGAAAGLGIYRLLSRNTPVIDTRNISIRQLTDHGQVEGFAAVSPDGRMIAYQRRGGERSLRVKQVVTGSEVTVVPPQRGFFNAATFTPDGNYLYYSHTDPTNPSNWNLYAVPALGGLSRQIVSDVCCGVAFLPDGKRMAYPRFISDNAEQQLLIANADGSGEHVILRVPGKEGYISAWAVAVDNIAIVVAQFGKKVFSSIQVYTLEGKLVKSIPIDMDIRDAAWLPDSSGLFFVGGEKSTGFRRQIWFQPYPEGLPFKISNDLNQDYSPSVTADGKSLVAIQQRPSATIYVGDSPSVLNDKIDWKLTPISHEQATGYSLSWTASGKLLQEDSADQSYMTAADGSARVRLLESHPLAYLPRSCGPGDVVILAIVSEHNQPNLWRFNVASGELKQLTFTKVAQDSSCTPDGKWVVYLGEWTTDNKELEHICRLSTDGGEPVELARGRMTSFPSVSPDGSFVAYTQVDGQGPSAKTRFVVQRLEGGAPVQELDAVSDAGPEVGWTPDGRALTYLHTIGSARHLFMRPLTGSTPVQLTHFDAEPSSIVAWAWSRDGKKIAITRARFNDTDVVMFSGFR